MLRKSAFFLLFFVSVLLGASDDNQTSLALGEQRSFQHSKPLHWKASGVELHFNTPIDPKKVHLFHILEPDKNRFRYVLDIPNTLTVSQVLVTPLQHKIRVSPYKQKTVRMVIEYHESMVIEPRIEGGNIYIDLALPSQASSSDPIVNTPLVNPNTFSIPTPIPPKQVDPIPILQPISIDDVSSTLPNDDNITLEKHPKIIMIDPGHGGKDAGALGNGVVEKEIVLHIGLQLSQKLQSMGYTVYMTRYDDTFIELKERTQLANDRYADLFVSIHANSIPKLSQSK